jgi:hypothetical protein
LDGYTYVTLFIQNQENPAMEAQLPLDKWTDGDAEDMETSQGEDDGVDISAA